MFGKGRIKRLEERVGELENELHDIQRDSRLYITESGFSPYGVLGQHMTKTYSLVRVVKMVLKHLKLEVTETPAIPPVVELTKIKPTKKEK